MASKCVFFLLLALAMSISAAPLDELERMLEDLLVSENMKDVFSKKQFGEITIDPQVTTVYNGMRFAFKYKWYTFKIVNKDTVVPDAYLDADATLENDKKTWDALVDTLTRSPRYILFDTNFTNREGRQIKKTFFMFWCPVNAKPNDKIIYGSSKDAFKNSLPGLTLEFKGREYGDMDYDPIRVKVEEKSK